MPMYTDRNGQQHNLQNWPGNSHKATVINEAYRTGNFEVHTIFGHSTVFFSCTWCHRPVTTAGIEGDHIAPQRMNGTGDAELQGLFDEAQAAQHGNISWNLALSCSECNGGTRNRAARQTRGAYRRARARYAPY